VRFRVAFFLLSNFALSAGFAQDAPVPATAEELVERERVRSGVERAFALRFAPAATAEEQADNYRAAVDLFLEIGEDAAPYLVSELEQQIPRTFGFSANMLGRIGGAQAEEGLRTALDAAESDSSTWGLERKSAVVIALALMKQPDAVDLLNSGRHRTGPMEVGFKFSTTEVVGLMTAPGSVPLLVRQLDGYKNDESQALLRVWTLRALRRIGDPSSAPKLIETLTDPDRVIRREAAQALQWIGTPESVDALLERLRTDTDTAARYSMAISLERILPAERLPDFVGLLETEDDPNIRGVIYRVIARIGGPEKIGVLRNAWGRPDRIDRRELIKALQFAPSPANLALYGAALDDPDPHVFAAAAAGLALDGSETALALLRPQIDQPNWAAAQITVRTHTEAGDVDAASRISRRLLEDELAGLVVDPVLRSRIPVLGDALVSLNYTDSLDALGVAAERQADGTLVAYLNGLLLRLATIRDRGEDVAKWIELLDSQELELRMLAYRRLSELGGKRAAGALLDRFGRVETEEGVVILSAVGAIDGKATRELLVRVLESPAFDSQARLPLRRMAAWSARRLGGAELDAAVAGAVDRDQGRDPWLLAYLIVMTGDSGVTKWRAYRVPRLQFPTATTGIEQDRLDLLANWVRLEQPLTKFDRPPDRLKFDLASVAE
jgi:HEAT repeat protein